MSPTSALPPTRQEIFRHGLHRATGTVSWIDPKNPRRGQIAVHDADSLRLTFRIGDFPPEERDRVGVGSCVVFDLGANQKVSVPKVTLPRLWMEDDTCQT